MELNSYKKKRKIVQDKRKLEEPFTFKVPSHAIAVEGNPWTMSGKFSFKRVLVSNCCGKIES